MGVTKRFLEDQEHKREVALAICVKAGTLASCRFHEDIAFMDSGDPQDAYKLGNHLYSNESWVSDAFESRREMTDYIQSVVDEGWDFQCNRCEELMSD